MAWDTESMCKFRYLYGEESSGGLYTELVVIELVFVLQLKIS